MSTAKPRLGASAPVLEKMTVYGREVDDHKVLVEARERREGLAGPGATAGSAPLQASLEDRGQSFILKLPRKVTVKADGRRYLNNNDSSAVTMRPVKSNTSRIEPRDTSR